MTRLSLAAALLVLSLAARADPVRVAVASNFHPVLRSLAENFEATSGHRLLISPGATGRQYAQIVQGAPFDVFLAADEERPALLEANGRAVAGSRFTYAIGRLVLLNPGALPVAFDAGQLHGAPFRWLAIANPELAPYGRAAREALAAIGAWEAIQPRLVRGENIAQALQFVATGHAELGLVALAQARGLDAPYALLPDTLHQPIVQQAVALRDTPGARALLEFLRSDAVRRRIRESGYDIPHD